MMRFQNGSFPEKRIIFICLAVAAALAITATAPIYENRSVQANISKDAPTIELSGESNAFYLHGHNIGGTGEPPMEAFKFSRIRQGNEFGYKIAGLEDGVYDIEFSFVEPFAIAQSDRVFDVSVNGSVPPSLKNIDIYARSGKNNAHQEVLNDVRIKGGLLDIAFNSKKGESVFSTIQIYRGKGTQRRVVCEINPLSSRNGFPTKRLHAFSGEDEPFEAVLGRMGSRFFINPVPQLLGWRSSPMGTATADIQEMVLSVSNEDGKVRALPFTPRYRSFENITQEMTATSITYSCDSQEIGAGVNLEMTAPFYPQDEKVSGAPLFYLTVEIKNETASNRTFDFQFAMPHRQDDAGSLPQPLPEPLKGYAYRQLYGFQDASRLSGGMKNTVEFEEAVSTNDDSSFTWHFNDIKDNSWMFPESENAQSIRSYPLYTFHPAGWSGFSWKIENLAPGKSAKRTIQLSAFTASDILEVLQDGSYGFKYARDADYGFNGVEDVALYGRDSKNEIMRKTEFFDSVFGEGYISEFDRYTRATIYIGLQNYLINTFWMRNNSDDDWYSVWEGSDCKFHSTIDVEYNCAPFYIFFWPELLGKLLDQWTLFEKSNARGTYLCHDMGVDFRVFGQAYPYDMPVEENCNYILLAYAYWKNTGDDQKIEALMPDIRKYMDFIMNCDTNGNGIPDIDTNTTYDDASQAMRSGSDSSYLAFKSLGAAAAIYEMEQALPSGNTDYAKRMHELINRINITLHEHSWLNDHYALTLNEEFDESARNSYSMHNAAGIYYLLYAGSISPIAASNLQNLETDIKKATEVLMERFGTLHESEGEKILWISQNMWRDAIACFLDIEGFRDTQKERSKQYLSWMALRGRASWGGFWDVCKVYDENFYSRSGVSGSAAPPQETAAGGQDSPAYSRWSSDRYVSYLCYYPRGTASLALIPSTCGLSVDLINGSINYMSAPSGSRVPVFSMADWSAADENKRVPVLEFDKEGNLRSVKNRHLLPPSVKKVSPRSVMSGYMSSSAGAGRDVAVETQRGIDVDASIYDEGTLVSKAEVEEGVAKWDGTDSKGNAVTDGSYTMHLRTRELQNDSFIQSDFVRVGVDSTVPRPSKNWYLAEGYTGGTFEQWILIQNPNSEIARGKITYYLEDAAPVTKDLVIQPSSRFTIHVDSIFPASALSASINTDVPVICERAMYFEDRAAGHATCGMDSLSKEWFFAEGYTGGSFDEWILLANPHDRPVKTVAEFMMPGGVHRSDTFYLAPSSRTTIHVNAFLPDQEISTHIKAERDIAAERAQYMNDMKAGTCSIGARGLSKNWYFAEGYTDQGFETWILVQNPNDKPVSVEALFMDDEGNIYTSGIELPAKSRGTIPVHDIYPSKQLSTSVTSTEGVIAERAMYWNDRSDGHATIGAPSEHLRWYLAEGYTGGGFQEYVLLQNATDRAANVIVQFLLSDGSVREMELGIPPKTRRTLSLHEIIPDVEVSTVVMSDVPLVCERAMYWNERSGGSSSIGVADL